MQRQGVAWTSKVVLAFDQFLEWGLMLYPMVPWAVVDVVGGYCRA